MTLGKYLRKVRIKRGLSQKDLAVGSELSPSEISRVETGKHQKPSPAVLKAFSEALAVDYAYLMRLAGYTGFEVPEKSAMKRVIRDEHHNIVDIEKCVNEMYEIDQEWLQTAYLVARELDEAERKIMMENVRMIKRIQKSYRNKDMTCN